MGRAKRWCTKTLVSSSVYRANGPVTVPLGYLLAQWTPLSENCDPFFNALGRTSDWDDRFGSGNPASHLCVKQYLKSIQSEQSQARVSPKQAIPVFFDKYKKLVYHLRQLLLGKNISPSERYIYARDLAFFSLDFFSGDRASELGRIASRTNDVTKIETPHLTQTNKPL